MVNQVIKYKIKIKNEKLTSSTNKQNFYCRNRSTLSVWYVKWENFTFTRVWTLGS